jgi:tRNA 2-thiouridine synthesizing protein B
MSEKRVLLWLNQAPFECDLAKHMTVLEAASAGGALLVQDAVYFATTDKGRRLLERGVEVYALRDSLEARGVLGRVHDGVTVVDYGDAVDLIMDRYDVVM